MKLEGNMVGLLARLGAMSIALLFAQQAMAVGTAAGTTIQNTASVDYFVNGVDQADISSNTVTFVVDRNVDFTLDVVGAALVPVTPGGNDYFVDFLLTNDSNSPLDFDVVLAQLVGGTVRGQADTADMDNEEFAVSANSVANGDTDPAQGGPQFVDELAADDAIRIRVWGDAALTLLNGQVAGLQVDATAAEPGTPGTEGAVLTQDPNTDLGVESVFADAGNDGTESSADGFIVVAAELTVTKSYAVISDPLGSGLPIPDAVIEYTISVANGSTTTSADAVSITDAIDGAVTFEFGAYGGAGLDIELDNGGTVTQCSADPAGADVDGCSLDGANLVVGNAAGPISIAPSATLDVTFQVRIPNPDPTP